MLRTTLDRIELTGTTRHPVAWLLALGITGTWALVVLSMSDFMAGQQGWVWLDALGREVVHAIREPGDIAFRLHWRARTALTVTLEAIQTGDPAHLLGSWTLLGWLRQVLSMGLLALASGIGAVAVWQGWRAWRRHQPMRLVARADGVFLDDQHVPWADLQQITLEGDCVILITRDGTRRVSAPLGYEAAVEADAVCQDVMDRLSTLQQAGEHGRIGGGHRDVPESLATLREPYSIVPS